MINEKVYYLHQEGKIYAVTEAASSKEQQDFYNTVQ